MATRDSKTPQQLLRAIERQARRGDVEGPQRLLGRAMSDPEQRRAMVPYIAAYLASCLQGGVPDLNRWTPTEARHG